jgi:hypothetical protein
MEYVKITVRVTAEAHTLLLNESKRRSKADGRLFPLGSVITTLALRSLKRRRNKLIKAA